MNTNISNFLNISRWVAAFLVVISHVRHLILVDWKDVQYQTILGKSLYFITGLGHEAVVVFFVISGYLVGGLTLERWRANGPDLRVYANSRISRIYTVLLPALVIGFTLDIIGLQWFNASELYTDSAQYHTISLSKTISSDLDLKTIIGNIFILQTILVGTLGSNGALWSLANEWWYYCIFALLGASLTGTGNKRIYYGLTACGLAFILPNYLILLGTIWLGGVAAYLWTASKIWRPHPALGFGVLIVATVVSRLSHNIHNLETPEPLEISFTRDVILGISYIAALVSVSRLTYHLPFSELHEKLAEFSFTTYCFHFPIMIFMVAFGYQVVGLNFQAQPTLYGLSYFATSTAIIYCYCYIFSLATEKHTNTVRKILNTITIKRKKLIQNQSA
jgi:peptidoglycan/LPS O-acetylase OafA/YrhL